MNNTSEIKVLKDIILKKCEDFKDNIAFLEKDKKENVFKEIKYSKLKSDVLSFGTALYYKLNPENEKIAVIGENSYKWFVTYMAAVSGVGVIVPLDKELPSNEIVNLLKRSKCRCIVYSSKKKDLINQIKKDLKRDMIYINMEQYKHDENSYSFDELISEGNELIDTGNHRYIEKEINPNDFAALLFTSGTTSTSKGVMLSNKNLCSNVNSIVSEYVEQSHSRFLSFLPMHHTYEFTITYLCPLSSGGTIGICEGLKYLIQNLKDVKPDCMCVVPLLLENIRKKLEKTIRQQNKEKLVKTVKGITGALKSINIDLRRTAFKDIHANLGGNLKYIFCGGAPIDKETIEVMESFGFTVFQGYGLTETSPLVAGTTLQNRRAGTVGVAIRDVEIRIDLKQDEIENSGEIIVKGPNVMLGYYEDEEETKKVLKKGWFYTGDIGYFDNKGSLVISGRTKNVIVTQNGKNIYPEEIENYINRIPLVSESLVFGDGDKNNLIVSAKVSLDEEYIDEKYSSNRPSDEEIHSMIWEEIKKINRNLVPYKAVKRLEIKKNGFIKTTTMKIKRHEEIKK